MNAKRQTPNAKRQTPNAKRQTPNARTTGRKARAASPNHKNAQTTGRKAHEVSTIAHLKAWAKNQPLIYYPVHYIKSTLRNIKPFIRWQFYKHTVRFNRSGLNTTEQRPRKIIASLTSYPARINIVPYVIASILNQTMKPDKIILWLGNDRFPDEKLPPFLTSSKPAELR